MFQHKNSFVTMILIVKINILLAN